MSGILKKYAQNVLDENHVPAYSVGKIKVTFLGVTTLLFDDGNTQILFDGMVTRPSIPGFLFRKLDTNRKLVKKIVKKAHMDRLKGIFVSHSHYDHVLDVPEFSILTDAGVYGSRSTCNIASGYGVAEKRIHLFQAGDTFRIGDFKIQVLESRHSKTAWYNDDLGVEITEPLFYPARKKKFTEGGSFDFYIEHKGQKILIRPSCNYIVDSLNDISADVLFLGIGQLSKMSDEEKDIFYAETVEKVQPKLVIPIHWENFFVPLRKGSLAMPGFLDHTEEAMAYMVKKTEENNVAFQILPVLKSVKL